MHQRVGRPHPGTELKFEEDWGIFSRSRVQCRQNLDAERDGGRRVLPRNV